MTNTTTAPVFEVRDLSVDAVRGSAHTPVLDRVSFDIAQGEVLGLVGESGSGKTVTSLAAMRLLPRGLRVRGGEVLLDGTDLLRLSPAELRSQRGARISMIFQDAMRCLNPAYTIGDQIAEPLRLHRKMSRKDSRKRAIELLEMVEIPRAADRISAYPHELSGGMCQRVMIATALACSPRVLIADEPTTALDVTVQKQVLKLLANLQAEMGLAVLLITHDLGVVSEICHRTAVMYAGEIVEQASTRDIFLAPAHPYTDGLISSLPSTDADNRRFGYIRGAVPRVGNWPPGCHFADRCDHVVTGRCTNGPIPIEMLGDRTVRCARTGELALEGVKR
ncbi:ABC transporter ATP-binding protein [Nocardia sp. NPDC052278]|uniref:ABC transporter ATP-binding protein n=1 Tax=unclassified Nocardia TaxID=2637762 RepID=UPI0036CC8B19